jgi:hypothetical protein
MFHALINAYTLQFPNPLGWVTFPAIETAAHHNRLLCCRKLMTSSLLSGFPVHQEPPRPYRTRLKRP